MLRPLSNNSLPAGENTGQGRPLLGDDGKLLPTRAGNFSAGGRFEPEVGHRGTVRAVLWATRVAETPPIASPAPPHPWWTGDAEAAVAWSQLHCVLECSSC